MTWLGDDRLPRRTVFGVFAAAGVAATVFRGFGRVGSRLLSRERAERAGLLRPRRAGREVREWMGEIRPGARVGAATVIAVHDLHYGAIPVRLRLDDGYEFQVDVLARGTTAGIASTRTATLHLANRADGSEPTHEGAGLATMELGRLLAERDVAGRQAPALLTHDGRLARFPHGRFAA